MYFNKKKICNIFGHAGALHRLQIMHKDVKSFKSNFRLCPEFFHRFKKNTTMRFYYSKLKFPKLQLVINISLIYTLQVIVSSVLSRQFIDRINSSRIELYAEVTIYGC